MIALVSAIATGPALLLIWSLVYPAQCWVLALPTFIALSLTLAARDRIRRRRECLANCYFVNGSLLHRLLRSMIAITLAAFFVSAALTTILLVSVPSRGFEVLALLALDSLAITLLYFGFFQLAGGLLKVNQAFRSLFARNWAVAVNVPLVLVALLMIQLHQTPPAYIDPSLDLGATMHAASLNVSSRCGIVDTLIRLNREAEAFSWWLMIKGTGAIEDSRLRWVAWIFFLLSGTLGLLAYSRLCTQLVYYAHRLGEKR